jgi:hypothetical protein
MNRPFAPRTASEPGVSGATSTHADQGGCGPSFPRMHEGCAPGAATAPDPTPTAGTMPATSSSPPPVGSAGSTTSGFLRGSGDCGHVPPAEYEAAFNADNDLTPSGLGNQEPESPSDPEWFKLRPDRASRCSPRTHSSCTRLLPFLQRGLDGDAGGGDRLERLSLRGPVAPRLRPPVASRPERPAHGGAGGERGDERCANFAQ